MLKLLYNTLIISPSGGKKNAETPARLKETSKKLRAVDRRIAKLEAKRAEAEAAEASAAKRIEIQKVITKLLDSGVAEDDILDKLNK